MTKSAKTAKAAIPPKPEPAADALTGGSVVGTAVLVELGSVQNNGWNPNHMPEHVRASLKHGLSTDGWLASQALLVWGTDEKGEVKRLIIDGEHRWMVAKELGFARGPAVFLHGLTEEKAKKLTVAMNQRRGEFDQDELSKLIQSLASADTLDLSLELGMNEEELMKLLAVPEQDLTLTPAEQPPPAADVGTPTAPVTTQGTSTVKMVQLFLDDKTHKDFMDGVKTLSVRYGTTNVTDTVRRAIADATSPAPEQGQ